MPSENIVLLTGHLGKAPEKKELSSGVIVCNFSIATNEGKDKPPMWHRCVCFGSQATDLAINGAVGDVVSLKGRIKYREYQGKYYTDIVVDHMHVSKKKVKNDEWEKE